MNHFIIIIVSIIVAAFGSIPALGNKENSGCGELGDCLSQPVDCTKKCGCDGLLYFNETTNQCVIDLDYMREGLKEKYDLPEKLRLEAEKAFNGILISILLFVICGSVCVVTACIYCCRMEIQDRKLKRDLIALAEKLKRDGKLVKRVKPKKTPVEPAAQSCNIIIEDAGVFVV